MFSTHQQQKYQAWEKPLGALLLHEGLVTKSPKPLFVWQRKRSPGSEHLISLPIIIGITDYPRFYERGAPGFCAHRQKTTHDHETRSWASCNRTDLLQEWLNIVLTTQEPDDGYIYIARVPGLINFRA